MWEKSKGTTKYKKINVTCDIGTTQCEDVTVKYDKCTVTCDISTAQCEDIKCEKKVRELPNIRK